MLVLLDGKQLFPVMYSPFSPLFPSLFGEAWEDHASARWYFSPNRLSSPWCLHLLCKSSEILYPEWQFIFIKLNRLKAWLVSWGNGDYSVTDRYEKPYIWEKHFCCFWIFPPVTGGCTNENMVILTNISSPKDRTTFLNKKQGKLLGSFFSL